MISGGGGRGRGGDILLKKKEFVSLLELNKIKCFNEVSKQFVHFTRFWQHISLEVRGFLFRRFHQAILHISFFKVKIPAFPKKLVLGFFQKKIVQKRRKNNLSRRKIPASPGYQMVSAKVMCNFNKYCFTFCLIVHQFSSLYYTILAFFLSVNSVASYLNNALLYTFYRLHTHLLCYNLFK